MKGNIIVFCCFIIFADTFVSNHSSLERKIISGNSVKINPSKFLASIRHNEIHFCTGALISMRHVLTAAKCLEPFFSAKRIPDFNNYSVQVGNSNVQAGNNYHLIEQVEALRRYDVNNKNSTYALSIIKLFHNITKSDYVNEIGMAHMSPRPFTEGQIGVWRITTNEGGSEYNDGITEVDLQIQSKHRHARLFGCEFSGESHETLYETDLGAPLVQNGLIVGVLLILPSYKSPVSIHADISKSVREICRLMENRRGLKRILKAPRKRARHDWEKL